MRGRAIGRHLRSPRPSFRQASGRFVPALLALVTCCAGFGEAEGGEGRWGAYTGYHFDHTQGDEGYGISWNYPDPASATDEALKACREREPAPPQEYADVSRRYSARRCGDVIFAFSTDGPDPEKVTRTPDPAWYQGFEKLTVLRRARCNAVFEVRDHPHLTSTNFNRYEGNDRASLEALGEHLYGKGLEKRTPSHPHRLPYRVAIIACNDL